MAVTGIIAEFDPFHGGHAHLIAQVRQKIPGTAVVIAMSGSFTQRGAPASADKLARARAAVLNGADLVLELPVSKALAPAPVFGRGGVELLASTGALTYLAFGSECGDISALKLAAAAEKAPDFSEKLKALVSQGKTYAAAAALAAPEAAEILSNPNDLLAVEYIRSLEKLAPGVEPVAVKRLGAAHGSSEICEYPSASLVRRLALEGVEPENLPLPRSVGEILAEEKLAGRYPLDIGRLDTSVLAVLCRMGEGEIAATPEGGDGLASRIFSAARSATTVEELCTGAKSRNFTLARVRRCVWQAYLGIRKEDQQRPISYLRVLALGEKGRELLRRMEETAALPVVTKPARLKTLGGAVLAAAELEARADSLRSLAFSAREDMFSRSPYVLK